jgi:bifunctional UDP-N-acetylglucosamine pyrophosphorylase/glucosamine-1-phosphate N-acetyltransferase
MIRFACILGQSWIPLRPFLWITDAGDRLTKLKEDEVELRPGGQERILQLLDKGVHIPNPLTLDIGDEVDVDRISGEDITIYPGCRIYGSKTTISSGARIGYEGPVTIENCWIGPRVELKGGYFTKSVFLEGSNMGLGAQVREACILEEEAGGAHCVGLKQTILFPFVTLGSLINLCDCFMAGGTSRKNHSEVGSSYIHFNFTPSGDKTTPSLVGDVARGVMLNQPPVFLGGQGGIVGPLRLGYGNVAAAGSILRKDYLEENRLIVGKTHPGGVRSFVSESYQSLTHITEKNVLYLANLVALEEWYRSVRKCFFDRQELGGHIYEGLIEVLSMARVERLKRLAAMAEKAYRAATDREGSISVPNREQTVKAREELSERVGDFGSLLLAARTEDLSGPYREDFLSDFVDAAGNGSSSYVETIQGLPKETSAKGVMWLDHVVTSMCGKVSAAVPSLRLFGR